MALKEYLTFNALITALIGISSGLTWKPDIRRYESYNLERGPVFYEAYYPEASEDQRNNYQEKRYFDRGAVLERTYQVPADRFAYPADAPRVDESPDRGGEFRYSDAYPGDDVSASMEIARRALPSEYDSRGNFEVARGADPSSPETLQGRFPIELGESMDVEEISNLARRAISRDLENWSALENYLDRAKHQDRRFRGERMVESARSARNLVAPANLKQDYEVESLRSMSGSRAGVEEKNARNFRRSATSVLGGRGMADSVRSIVYPNLRPAEESGDSKVDVSSSKTNVDHVALGETIANGPLAENIFEPRPQVINYVFSRDPEKSRSAEARSVAQGKDEPRQTTPRSYGDNLIREEMKRSEEDKPRDVQVTSIVVSEVPRHKTRHHHGEWPKRDYPRHR